MAAKLSGFSSEVVRMWAWTIYVEYFGRLGNFDDVDDVELVAELTSNRGKHATLMTLFEDEQFQLDAREYNRSASYRKGAPNMTVFMYQRWIEEEWGVPVGKETARTWFHKLVFQYKQHSNGVYFDGHERKDVV